MAMLLDCQTLDTDFAGIPDDMAFIVIDSGAKHQFARQRLQRSCRRMPPGGLRSSTTRRFPRCDSPVQTISTTPASALGDVLYRRCRHVVTEKSSRTQAAFDAFE